LRRPHKPGLAIASSLVSSSTVRITRDSVPFKKIVGLAAENFKVLWDRRVVSREFSIRYDNRPFHAFRQYRLGEHSVHTTLARRFPARLVFVSLLACAGCGDSSPTSSSGPGSSGVGTSSASGSGPSMIFVTNGTSDWWNAVEKGMNDGAAEFKAQVEMRRNRDSQVDGQIRLLEDVLSRPDIQGVAISVQEADSPGIADKMRELQKAGKVVITIDSDGQKDARRAYIGTNNVKAGEVAGNVAKMLRPQGGKTVAFVGTAAAANARERREGFFLGAGDLFRVDAQKDALEVLEDGTEPARAQSNVQTAITKHPEAGVYLGLWSYNAHNIAEEVAKFPELRKKTTVVTFDLDELAGQDVAQGKIDATVCQNPYEMGYRAVRLLKALIEKDRKTVDDMLPGGTDSIDTGVRVVVPRKDSPVKGDNVIDIEEMKSWLASKGLRST
jgi:ribose transport system substrate-binding protein